MFSLFGSYLWFQLKAIAISENPLNEEEKSQPWTLSVSCDDGNPGFQKLREGSDKNDIFPFQEILLPQLQTRNGIHFESNSTTASSKSINFPTARRIKSEMYSFNPIDLDENVIEDIVNTSIDSYYTVDELLSNFNYVFGRTLMTTILVCIVMLLTNTFFIFMWVHKEGMIMNICCSIIPMIIFSMELFLLTSVAENLHTEADKIFAILNDLPFDCISPETLSKIQLLALKITSTPPRIEPCRFFRINRSLITSILSALTMYLIVLVQFENAD
ncbi:unnamed protein product [Allacma fusca]|uniref:Gustatory receptor n=1 Tax=Allacma fusca TaxID=39272 RepID=A0A8J2KER3_9HEXA|nr:unnamed protein product [Allacma fusca]